MHKVHDESGTKLALIFDTSDIQEGLTFFTDDADLLQVGSWNYHQGKRLLAHNHHIVERVVNRTQEFVYIVRGRLKASIYDEEDRLVEDAVLEAGSGLICFAGGHGYEILADDTVVLEIKNGPYVGAERDRRRLEEG